MTDAKKDEQEFPAAYYKNGDTRLVKDEDDAAAAKKEGWGPHPTHPIAGEKPERPGHGGHPSHPIVDEDDEKPSPKPGKK